jgi:hypothetical protein
MRVLSIDGKQSPVITKLENDNNSNSNTTPEQINSSQPPTSLNVLSPNLQANSTNPHHHPNYQSLELWSTSSFSAMMVNVIFLGCRFWRFIYLRNWTGWFEELAGLVAWWWMYSSEVEWSGIE